MEEVALHGTLLTVDEGTPIGQKWRELGALAFSVLANAQTMPDALGAFQTFKNGAIVLFARFRHRVARTADLREAELA